MKATTILMLLIGLLVVLWIFDKAVPGKHKKPGRYDKRKKGYGGNGLPMPPSFCPLC